MGKKKRKYKKKAVGGDDTKKVLGDVTINEFANSNVCPRKPKKCDVSNVIKFEPTSWDDYNVEDYDYVEEINEDGTVTLVATEKGKLKPNIVKPEGTCGNEYPLDIWYLISEHIRPEDVGRFSGICKMCYAVTNSARFWYGLYNRYYEQKYLPEHLKPRHVSRMYGIRTLVIKSLYFMYPPFVDRCKVDKYKDQMEVLLRKQCVNMGVQRLKGKWYYYFKLQQVTDLRKQPKVIDLIEMLEDISANNEENCMLLKVIAFDYFLIPPVQGMYLTSIRSKLGQDMRHYKLQLTFGPAANYASRTTDGEDSTQVLIDPVYHIEILDWWHSRYPHSYNMKLVLNQE